MADTSDDAVIPSIEPRPVGWFTRMFWYCYRPRLHYRLNSGVSVVECSDKLWPVLMQTVSGETHVWRMSRETARALSNFVSEVIAPDLAERTAAPASRDDAGWTERIFGRVEGEFDPGDGVKVWKYRHKWHLAKTTVGMPRLTLEFEEWIALRGILERILRSTQDIPDNRRQ